MDFMDCSPKTKRIASTTFDLPEPFGPTTQTIGCENSKTVFLEKDLKPLSSRVLSRMFILIPANFSLLMPFRRFLLRFLFRLAFPFRDSNGTEENTNGKMLVVIGAGLGENSIGRRNSRMFLRLFLHQ